MIGKAVLGFYLSEALEKLRRANVNVDRLLEA
jgi:hypothetical protein